jgi:long-chain acyl-CoA synthetase
MNAAEVHTLVDVFRVRAAEAGSRPAMLVKQGGAWRKIGWDEVAAKARAIAAGLAAAGVAPGDRVAILSENRPEWALADLGILSAGAVSVPIYATNLAKQCEYIWKNSGAVATFVSSAGDKSQLDKALESQPECPALKTIVAFEAIPEGKARAGVLSLGDLIAKGEAKLKEDASLLEARAKTLTKDSIASIIYTSGTTGDPKGVVLTHENFASNVKAAVDLVGCGPEDVFLSFLPLSHSFERMAGHFLPIYAGALIAYAESIDKVRANLPEVRPTIMCSVPRLYEKIFAGIQENVLKKSPRDQKIFAWGKRVGEQWSAATREGRAPGLFLTLKHAVADRLVLSKIRALFGGRLRFFVSGGAPLAREIALFFHAFGIIILEGYGLSETSPLISVNRPDALKIGTVGKVIPGVEVKIEKDGEILVRGPNVMREYYRNETATREVIDADRWFKTGDIGEVDADGFLKITDRKKDLMKTSGGKYIAPQNIENDFKTDRFIGEFVVIAENRNYPTALVIPKFDALEAWAKEQGVAFASRKELVESAAVKKELERRMAEKNHHLPQYEKIKKWRVLDRELSQEAGEITPTLKVKRKVVNAKFKDLIEEMYAEGKEAAASA